MVTKKILVVDDEENICQSVEKILSRRGYRVDKALSAELAIKKMEEENYDLLITDLMMPKTSGIELVEILRKHYPELNVIMITGYASIDSAVQATKLGVKEYLPKPFTPDELATVTERVIKQRHSRKDASTEKKAEQEKKSDDQIDVDLPFSQSEVEKYTSKEYVEALTHSDVPVSSKMAKLAYCELGKRNCRRIVTQGKMCDNECPIEKKERTRKVHRKVSFDSKGIIDVDMPFNMSEMESYSSIDYINCLDRSDIPRVALYGRNSNKKNNILVVDDEPIVCASIRKILSKKNYFVDEVFDVDSAMTRMKLNKYDLILLDLKMPKKSGLEVLNSIKKLYPQVPVVMITGYATIETAIEATKLGAHNFIPKPFTPEELAKITDEALA